MSSLGFPKHLLGNDHALRGFICRRPDRVAEHAGGQPGAFDNHAVVTLYTLNFQLFYDTPVHIAYRQSGWRGFRQLETDLCYFAEWIGLVLVKLKALF